MTDQTKTADQLAWIITISCEECVDRASLWGDMADEFLRLALLSQTLRGEVEILEVANKAAALCCDEMTKEIDKLGMAAKARKSFSEQSVLAREAVRNAGATLHPRIASMAVHQRGVTNDRT